MRYRSYRTPAQRRRRRRIGRVLLLFSALLFLSAYLLKNHLFPIAQAYAENRAKTYAVGLINQAVQDVLADQAVTYDTLVQHEELSDGRVTSVEADSIAIDGIKTAVVQQVQILSEEETEVLKIPLGTLTDIPYFIGWGPNISVKMRFSPYVTADITSEFQSAGINQTLHQMMLHVSAEVYMLLPGEKHTAQVDTDFCLAETVLVGEVPDAYTNVKDGELANNIADYGATTGSTQ